MILEAFPVKRCPSCSQLNLIKPHSLRYKPVCKICRTDLPYPYRIGEEVYVYENNVPVERLSFELLPPGSWDIEDVIQHYCREAENLPSDLYGREMQYERLIKIKTLKPQKCYIGTELWLGYVLFEFQYTDRVALECPIEGNATYVLSGNWKQMVRHSKQYIRRYYSKKYTKVVHKGDWLDRVRNAL